jgi:lysophospholipase L1-like esterase
VRARHTGLAPAARTAFVHLALALAAGAAVAQPQARSTVVLVGDSTMAPGNGYGPALCQRLAPGVACINLARNGRSTRSYRDEGLWREMLAGLPEHTAAGRVHVLIQFGHNDQPGKPGRSTDLATEYPANLERYVADVRAAGAVPVLVTPLTRRRFHDGVLVDDLQPWAQSMRDVARRLDVALIDLHASSRATVQALGSDAADRLATAARGGPGFDHTHLGARGGCVFARLVLQELRPLLGITADPAGRDPGCDTRSP